MKKQVILWLVVTLATSLLIRVSREYLYEPVETSKVDTLSPLIDKLAMCESSGRTDIKILDSNNKYSYGLLQFQEDTFVRYTKKYNFLPEAEESEYMNFIYDGEYQKRLANEILKEPKGIYNWYNCGVRFGVVDKTVVIK